MKIVIDINHPAHVHFFKNVRIQLLRENHEVYVIASKKTLVYELLRGMNIDFIPIGSYGKSFVIKALMYFVLNIKMYLICRRIRPDLVLGIATIRGAQISKLLGFESFVFTDTEHATEQIKMFAHFATRIYTPFCFTRQLGERQVFYQSIHEMSYLHNENYVPDIKVFDHLGLAQSDKYFVLRFVAWDATHDIGQKGISSKGKRELISYLEDFGKVFISTEGKPDDEFKKYELKVDPWMLHHVLFYAQMYVGEGATMAVEASILGTPSIYVNSLQMGYTAMIENDYDILVCLKNDIGLLGEVESIIKKSNNSAKNIFRDRISENLINTADFIVGQIINNAS